MWEITLTIQFLTKRYIVSLGSESSSIPNLAFLDRNCLLLTDNNLESELSVVYGLFTDTETKSQLANFTVGVKKLHTTRSLKNTLRHVNFGWFFCHTLPRSGKNSKSSMTSYLMAF